MIVVVAVVAVVGIAAVVKYTAWPSNEYTALLPKPEGSVVVWAKGDEEQKSNVNEVDFYVTMREVTSESFKAYVDECVAKGFEIKNESDEKIDGVSTDIFAVKDGYVLELAFGPESGKEGAKLYADILLSKVALYNMTEDEFINECLNPSEVPEEEDASEDMDIEEEAAEETTVEEAAEETTAA